MANNKKNTSASTTNEAVEVTNAPEARPIIPKEIDPNQIVIVRNGHQGKLVYKSPRTHEVFKWDSFGDEQEMELREIRNAKSSAKKFFINNWFMFDEEFAWVIDYLGLKQYYKNAISLDDFDEIFQKNPDEIKDIVSRLSKGQKKSVAYRARQLIANGEIDSYKVVAALEKVLGVDLIEK